MNKRRRRIGRRRRAKKRLIREIRNWTMSASNPPISGRLARPIRNLIHATELTMYAGFIHLERWLAPVMAFAGRGSPAPGPDGGKR